MRTNDGAVFRTVRLGRSLVVVSWIGLMAGVAGAQGVPASPVKPAAPVSSVGAYNSPYRAGLVCGGGDSVSSVTTKPTMQCGGILGFYFFDLEVGAMGPTANHNSVSAYLSTNLFVPLVPLRDIDSKHGVPIAVGGYTQMFGASNALNYGVAYAYPVGENHSVQFEARDYWTVASPSQHNIAFRVVWLVDIPDP
jgi:hypothetical protein